MATAIFRLLTCAFAACPIVIASMAAEVRSSDRRIDVAGHAVHVLDTGSGNPAVVFVSGMGEDLHTWDKVQPQIAGFARAISLTASIKCFAYPWP